MPISEIHSFLVPPLARTNEFDRIKGTTVPAPGDLYDLLSSIYDRSDSDCRIEISFNIADDGSQQNNTRSLILDHVRGPTLATGRALAEKLGSVSTNRSGLGLLFLIVGEEGGQKKIVVARFPADNGILANENADNLDLEFIEQVFMKSAKAFKAVTYRGRSLANGFWTGRAIDKQVSLQDNEISAYWISKFLESDFRTTSAEGTRRLAVAMRSAARSSDTPQVKAEISAAAMLARGLGGVALSPEQFFDRFGFSEGTKEAVRQHLGNSRAVAEQFQFDVAQFIAQVPYRSVELDTGAVLTAPADRFDAIIIREAIAPEDDRYRFTAEGSIANQQLKKTKQ